MLGTESTPQSEWQSRRILRALRARTRVISSGGAVRRVSSCGGFSTNGYGTNCEFNGIVPQYPDDGHPSDEKLQSSDLKNLAHLVQVFVGNERESELRTTPQDACQAALEHRLRTLLPNWNNEHQSSLMLSNDDCVTDIAHGW